MLLRRVEIRDFRGLRQAAIDFDPTTALVGENSAGKTTLLDAWRWSGSSASCWRRGAVTP